MQFAVLGPLEVRSGDRLVPLRRGRPRILLTALLLRVGRVTSADALIEDVWQDHELTNAGNALQVQISYLRRALRLPSTQETPALRTVAGGYLLDVDPESIDAHRFERLVKSAAARLTTTPPDAGTARDELQEALGLWRGEALQDVAYERFAGPEIERLNELRVAAQEYEVDARLELGEHELVVAELRQLIAAHPLRERLRAQLVLALYRSGRQADALRELEATRLQLVEELGVDLGPELQRLQRAVLDQQPDLDWRAADAAGDRPAPTIATGATPGRFTPQPLPAPTTRLVGRRREVDRIHEALADNRLVTLTGAGGVGKSRLALAIAQDEADRRAVWFVELADVADERLVPFEIAHTVGVAKDVDPFEALAVGIGDRAGLLVLDTCEHLVDACAAASHRLLRACPGLTVLTTSRQPLAVPGEVAWPVPPLAVPPPDVSWQDVADVEAARLFRDRGRAVRPDFELDASNGDDVAAICRVLDGLPLAIELAAARISVLSPAAIVARLDDRFALLRRVGRAADLRQQSLRATIHWSYDLLDDDQRRFFERLGAFAGRFSLAAVGRVAADGLATDPLELLSAMIDRSLVVVDGDDSYRMLDSLRAFALDRLAECPSERDAARARLAAWLTEYCETQDANMRGPGEHPVFVQLRAEMPNLRAALEWSFGGGDPAVGVRLVCSLAWFWGAIGANPEANRWLRAALETTGLHDQQRARLLEGVALHAFASGELRAGQAAADEAARHWAASGTPEEGFATLIYQGLAQRSRRQLDAAAQTLDRAAEIARQQYGDWARAVTLYWRAATAADQEDDVLAVELLGEALVLADRAGDRRAVGSIVHQLGRIALRDGDAERALELGEQALAIHEAIGWSPGIAAAEEAIGRALLGHGRVEESIASHRRALQRAISTDTPAAIAKALEGFAHAAAAAGAPVAGAEALGSAGALRDRLGAPEPATQRRAVERIEVELTAQLGDAQFQEALRRGRQLDPAEVVAAAVG